MSQDPAVSLDRIAAVVSRDLGMSASVLKLVNSSYFGLARPVESIHQSVMLLGLDTVRALVLGTTVFREYRSPTPPALSVEQLWEHSLRVAAAAREIARTEHATTDLVGKTYLAALLHDVGKLLLASSDPDRFRGVTARAVRGAAGCALERELFAATHAEVGAYLLGLWNFGDAVVRAVAFHHRPADAHEPSASPTTWVHVANAIAGGGSDASALDRPFLEAQGLAGRLREWESRCSHVGATAA